MSLGKLFLSAILAEKSVAGLLSHGPIDHLFKASEEPAYQFVKEFVKLYQALPTPDTIEAHTGETLVPHKEPSAYYFDLLETRHVEVEIKKGLKKASDLLLPENKDPDAALHAIMETAMALAMKKQAAQVVDFRHAYDILMADYVSKWNKADSGGLMLGWPTLDEMTGGLVKGDMFSLIGFTGEGKTWLLLYSALFGWMQSALKALDDPLGAPPAQSRLFVSMEMGVLPIQQRMISIVTKLNATKVKNALLSTTGLKTLKKGLTEIKGFGAPFWVVDGNLAATVEDVEMLARQLKPDGIFIDGGYLMAHPKEQDRYKRVAVNADLMKQRLTPIAPTAVSWQFDKSVLKKKDKKKGDKIDLGDISHSQAIAQNSSLVAGLMQENSIETLLRKVIDILKGRNGEVGSFPINWNFNSMDFTEIFEEEVEDLQFL